MQDSSIMFFLKRSLINKTFASVFTNSEQPDKCSVGFVGALTEGHVLINHVTYTGLSDGFAIRRVEDIFRIDFDGQYEQKLEKLYFLQKQFHQELITSPISNEINLFKEVLVNSQRSGRVVDICIDYTESQEDVIGRVKEVNDIEVVISRISQEGKDDGESVLFLNDIIKLNCDSQDEHILQLLYEDCKSND